MRINSISKADLEKAWTQIRDTMISTDVNRYKADKNMRERYYAKGEIGRLTGSIDVIRNYWKTIYNSDIKNLSESEQMIAKQSFMQLVLQKRTYNTVEQVSDLVKKDVEVYKHNAESIKKPNTSQFAKRRDIINQDKDKLTDADILFDLYNIELEYDTSLKYESTKIVDYIYTLAESDLSIDEKIGLLQDKGYIAKTQVSDAKQTFEQSSSQKKLNRLREERRKGRLK